tara:strand:+ start:84 stop:527 length:444 start_codon:yes stop_codon:yes gene_type:complete
MIGNFLTRLSPSYKAYWQGGFDFEGKTTRIDFWAAKAVSEFAVFAVYVLGKFFNDPVDVDSDIVIAINYTWVIVNIIPNFSLYFRRFRDTGMRLWMPTGVFLSRFILSLTGSNFGGADFVLRNILLLVLVYFVCKPSQEKSIQKEAY